MKRFFSLALLLILFGSAAMYADPHMSFMGIPMNGNLSTFCGKLVSQKGLRIVERDDDKGVYTLSGKFAGYNNCEFYIFDNDDTHQGSIRWMYICRNVPLGAALKASTPALCAITVRIRPTVSTRRNMNSRLLTVRVTATRLPL